MGILMVSVAKISIILQIDELMEIFRKRLKSLRNLDGYYFIDLS